MYPWQREQDGVLQQMIDVGLVAVMIRWPEEILADNAHRDTAHPGETGMVLVQYPTGPRRG